ncbi:MAG: TonB-dependent receptor [Prevotella sp.]|nr:TonB-dependent receptor [Prevotella sp.]
MEKVSLFGKALLFLFLLIAPPVALHAQEVKGTVTDASTGEPLIGVTIKSLDTKAMAVTDFDGQYTISSQPNDRLQFSYVGYEEETVKVGTRRTVDVELKALVQSLNDIVVIGYGTQRKADLTGSVGVVDMEEAKKTAATNIYEMLQGQVPGISVSTTSQPGAMSHVQIRGVGSFNTVGPLYVLDGMIVNDVNHLNPNEIESMQVLKDASAAAIYGARGANGVILIETKKGKKGQPTLDVSATWSVADLPKKIDMMSTTDFMRYNEQAYLNANADWPGANYSSVNTGKYIPNTDWQKAAFQTGFTQDYNIMYAQGSDNVNMAIGAGYMDQKGVIEGPKYQRFTARMNADATYGILKIGYNSTFQHTISHETITGASNGGPFVGSTSMPPVIPVWDPFEPAQHKGDPGFGYGSQDFPTYASNPVGVQYSNDNLTVNNRIIANAFAELKLFKHFTYKLNFGVDAWFGRHKNIAHCYTTRMGSAEQRYDDVLTDNRDQRATTILDNTLTYQNSFGKHNLTALVGHTAEEVNWHWLEAQGYNQQVEGLYEISLVGTQNNMAGKPERRRQLSYIGRIDYNYDGKYLAQFNFRSDGSSKFGTNKRRGYFPSFSFGWRISEEKFWEPVKDVVDNLKLRASWGKVGDMQSLGNYSYIPTIDHSGPYEGYFAVFGPAGMETINYGATQSSKVNVDLGWETKTTTNIGVDFNMFNSRLFGSFEWFNAKSTDLLLNVPQSWATGISSLWTNYGEMRNRGIELMIGWRDKLKDFDYSISANLSTVRNKVLKMGDAYVQEGYTRSEVGRSISDFYLLKADGIFQSMDEILEYTTTLDDGSVRVIQPNAQPGDVKYIDVNGDGQIDDTDKDWCGSPLPKFELGFNVSLGYKGFDFNMLWAGRFGNKIYNERRASTLGFTVDNIPADATPWTWDNPSNTYPRMYANSTDNNKASDRFLEKGTYFRMKNIQLGYTLPSEITRKIYLQKLRAYVSGTNLVTFTGYKGYDPDIICTYVYAQGIDWEQYPSTRQINFGLQVTF